MRRSVKLVMRVRAMLFMMLGLGAANLLAAPLAYITNQLSGTLQPVDLAATPAFRPAFFTTPGASLFGVAVSPDGKHAYVTDQNGAVSVIDTATGAALLTFPVSSPFGIAVSPDGTKVYVAGSGGITIFDATTNQSSGFIAAPGPLSGIAVSPDGSRIYVARFGGGPGLGALLVVDATLNSVVTIVPMGATILGVAVSSDGTRAYAADTFGNVVFVLNTATNSIIATVSVGAGARPIGIATTPGGGNVYVTNRIGNSVSVIASATNTVITTIPVDVEPTGIAVSPDGSRAYAVNKTSATISVIDTATLALASTIPLTAPVCSSPCSGPSAFGSFIGRDLTTVTLTSDTSLASLGDPLTFFADLNASASPGGTVAFCDGGNATDPSFCSSGTLVCPGASVNAATNEAVCTTSSLSAGNHFVTARYSGDGNSAPAISNVQHVSIDGRMPQSIAFTSTPPDAGIVGVPYAISATASSGLPVTFSIPPQASGVCAISGNSVSFNAPGLCRVQADQAGNVDFRPETAQQAIDVPCYVNAAATGANNGHTWANAYRSLQSALQPQACFEIWVAQGVYKPGTDPGDTFNVLPFTYVFGGFAGTEKSRAARNPHKHPTVLSGDIDGNDAVDAGGVDQNATSIVGNNSQTIVTLDATTPNGAIAMNIHIDGFTITGGASSTGGGGMRCIGNAPGALCKPSLRNMIFSGNKAGSGGAMFNDGSSGGESSPQLSNTTFSGNAAIASGGAVYNMGASGTANPVFTNVTFVQNAANNGGAMYNDGADSGQSNPALSFVTFMSNSAANCGGAIFNAATNGNSDPLIIHSLLWNDASTVFPAGNEICNNPLPAAYTAIGGSLVMGSHGSGAVWDTNMGNDLGFNVDADPLLGTLQYNGGTTPTTIPSAGGAAFNAANDCTDALAQPLALDQRGVQRPYAGACDIGAVESSSDRIFADGLEYAPL
jgi:YVTN family beta-propeller protein